MVVDGWRYRFFMSSTPIHLVFIVCVSNDAVLQRHLLRSPCIQSQKYPVHIHYDCKSAADAFNPYILGNHSLPENTWLAWVHQDVYLPSGWDRLFITNALAAQNQFPRLSILGLYGVQGAGSSARRVGRILDRGHPLEEKAKLPSLVDSLDELFIAVNHRARLGFDPLLGFDFYGTDIVLQAHKKNMQAAVIEAPCEHWSSSPQNPPFPPELIARIEQSALVFEKKWAHRFPITTPCFEIDRTGSTSAFLRSM